MSPAVFEWFVQKDGKVRQFSEGKLRADLRNGKYTGLELVRRADQTTWQPLHETQMFVEEVPMQGHPLDHARWRMVRGFGVHFLTYLAVNILVGFAPLGGEPRLAGTAAIELDLDFRLGDRDQRRAAVNDAADRRPVAFAPGGDPEQMADRVVRH